MSCQRRHSGRTGTDRLAESMAAWMAETSMCRGAWRLWYCIDFAYTFQMCEVGAHPIRALMSVIEVPLVSMIRTGAERRECTL